MWIVQLGLPRPYSFGAAKVDLAVTQTTAQAQSSIGAFPPGTRPPSIPDYDSPRVSIPQSGLEGKVLAPQELLELGQNFVPAELSTVDAASVRVPNEGKFRAVEVDLKPDQMHEHPTASPGLPKTFEVRESGDQSLLVQATVSQAVMAAFRTGRIILLIRRSSRGTLIVYISVPPAILTSVGARRTERDDQCDDARQLVLAVGILVNDAAVTLENKHRSMALGKPRVRAAIDGASDRRASFRFRALDLHPAGRGLIADGRGEIPVRARQAVVLAMLASYSLSPTLIPAVVDRLVKPEVKLNTQGVRGWSAGGRTYLCGVHHCFTGPLALIRSSYGAWLDGAIDRPGPVLTGFAAFDKRLAATRDERRPRFLPHRQFRPDGLPCQGCERDPGRADGRDLWRAPTVILYYVCQ